MSLIPILEDPTCHGATKLLSPRALEPMLFNKRSHRNEKPSPVTREQPLLAATRGSLQGNEDPTQPKINKIKFNPPPPQAHIPGHVVRTWQNPPHWAQLRTDLTPSGWATACGHPHPPDMLIFLLKSRRFPGQLRGVADGYVGLGAPEGCPEQHKA